MISIVCPFYNEESILAEAVEGMLEELQTLPDEWELIIVNDGSTDGSLAIAAELEREHSQLRVVSYDTNHGRGYALRTGIHSAAGHLIFTTEIDRSWGPHIVHTMYSVLCQNPDADIVVASPHLEGGGYKNVPLHRVLLSRVGNRIIRTGLSFAITMNTGMTRGYRREAIVDLPLFENGKEFHLEVLLKALAFGKRIIEVPAVLEWQEHKQQGQAVKRRSSSKIPRLVNSHLLFSSVAAPIRYLWVGAAVSLTASAASGGYAILRFLWDGPYANAILGWALFSVLAVLLFSFGVISEQNRMIMKDLWRIQAQFPCLPHAAEDSESGERPYGQHAQRQSSLP